MEHSSKHMWSTPPQPLIILYLTNTMSMTTKFGRVVFTMRGSPNKVKCPFDNMVLGDHFTNSKHVSTTSMLMTTKLGRMLTYLEGFLPRELLDPLVTWSYKIT